MMIITVIMMMIMVLIGYGVDRNGDYQCHGCWLKVIILIRIIGDCHRVNKIMSIIVIMLIKVMVIVVTLLIKIMTVMV